MKRPTLVKDTSQLAALKRTPSKLFAAVIVRSGAGVHADQSGRYGKRERASLRADERRARLGASE